MTQPTATDPDLVPGEPVDPAEPTLAGEPAADAIREQPVEAPRLHRRGRTDDEPPTARELALRERLLGDRPTLTGRARLWGWLGPLVIAAVGGLLRFWDLGRPHQIVFDETYYVKQGVSMLRYGVEMRVLSTLKEPDVPFAQGRLDIWSSTEGDLVVHPPVGKWVIAFGEWVFGPTSSFGWRFSVALCGTLSILLIGRVALRLFGSVALACVASFLLAFEGFHFVMSRLSVLDMILEVFVLAAFAAVLLDRDRTRALLARKVGALPTGSWPEGAGPFLGWRPWLWVAGLSLGLATGTKLSGGVYLAAFGLLTVAWTTGARRAAGIRSWWLGALLKDGPVAFLAMVGTAGVVYVASWVRWFTTSYGYHRHWDQFNPGMGVQWLPPVLRNWVHYQWDMVHSAAAITSAHPYAANPWGWVVQARPTSLYYESPVQGVEGCTVAQCSKAINPIGTISIWWLAVVALVVCLWWWAVRRDWRAGAIWCGVAAGWFPWFLYQGRTVFSFYTVVFEPYVVLGLVFVIGLWLGAARSEEARRRRVWGLTAYLLFTLLLFAFFWPVYTAQVVPYDMWHIRMWFPSWV